MRKLILGILFLLACCIRAGAQVTPATYTYKGEKLLVFPFRISYQQEVPMAGYKLPDGKYVLFYEYRFKKKLFKKALKLRDTTVVSGTITLKDNQPEGPATFIEYEAKSRDRLKKKPESVTTAFFKNGLKDGAWTELNRSGHKEITTYKDGLLNGYSYFFDSQNRLVWKKKYLNEKAIDTVFDYFPNGRIMEIYDVRTEDFSPDFGNFYAWLARKKSLMPYGVEEENIRSFYRSYDSDGNIENDLQFKNGNMQAFNKLSRSKTWYYTLQNLNPGLPDTAAEFIFTEYSTNYGKDRITDVTYYKNFEIQKEYTVYRHEKTKTTDTTFTQYFDIDKSNMKSKKPFLVSTYKSRSILKNTWYIPYYKYTYVESNYPWSYNSNPKPVLIDTAKGLFYLNDTVSYEQGFRLIKHKLVYDEDQYEAWEAAMRPYKANRYLFSNSYRKMIHEETDASIHNFNAGTSHYRAKQYHESNRGRTLLKDGKPFSGKAFLYESKIKFNKKDNTWTLPQWIRNNSNTVAKGEVADGRFSGTWETLPDGTKINSKKDFLAYFKKHPKTNGYYYNLTYGNGYKNGTYFSYHAVKVNDLWYLARNKSKSERKKIIVFKDEECNYVNDTLHGEYKTWYANGKLREVMNYNMGKPNGKYLYYDEEGNIDYSMEFKDGKIEGEYIYNSDGKPAAKGYYRNNKLDGRLTYFERTGLPYLEIEAKEDTVKSKKIFFKDGALKEQILFHTGSEALVDSRMLSSNSYLESIDARLQEFNFMADYTNYYENGKVLSKGLLRNGNPYGKWQFYNTNNTVINDVVFDDTSIVLPGTKDTVNIIGYLNGYYHNGKPRTKGYLRDFEAGYDCSLHQDMTTFDYYIIDFWTIDGKQTCSKGNGELVVYNEGAQRIAQGGIKQGREDGLWKYYDPDQKLKEIGRYVNGSREGVWYKGDLEGINFEDNACFDETDSLAMKELAYSKKVLNFEKIIYKNDRMETRDEFTTDQNKERDYEEEYKFKRRRRGRMIVDF